MREPMPDTTWEAFLEKLYRERDEIEIAMGSATWWEREQYKARLREIRFEIGIALEHVDYNTYTGKFDEVPW